MPLFTLFRRISAFFLFQFLSDLGRSKRALGSFFAFFTKIWPKNIYYTTRTQSFKFDLFDLVTLDVFIWHKVTKDLGGTKRYPRRDPFRSSALFQFDKAALPTKPARTENQFLPLTRHETSSVTSKIKLCNIFGKFKLGSIRCRFRIENGPRSLADSKGAETHPPPIFYVFTQNFGKFA